MFSLLHRHLRHSISIPTDADDEAVFRLAIYSVTNVDQHDQHLVFTTTENDSEEFTTVNFPPYPFPQATGQRTMHTGPTPYVLDNLSGIIALFQRENCTTTAVLLEPYRTTPSTLTEDERTLIALERMLGPIQTQEKTAASSAAIRRAPLGKQNSMFQFMSRVQSASKSVRMYEDHDLQHYALSKMPLASLYTKAAEDTANNVTNPNPLLFGDHLVRRFGHWFRHSFFTWMNGIACSTCASTSTSCIGRSQPNVEEQRWMAGTVEIYKCQSCGANTRFPRYNHPRKLLETRIGRCGEFANCFTLCLRALRYEVRHITDWTDHVWTEFYSNNLKRWIHFDSCENAFDSPLMYSNGWGKKLSYVVGCSKTEVVDVSARYVSDYKDMLTRRTLVEEQCLPTMIDLLDFQARMGDACGVCPTHPMEWSGIAARRREEQRVLEDRKQGGHAKMNDGKTEEEPNGTGTATATATATATGTSAGESKEDLTPHHELTDAEKSGRTTGSVAWRAARGELGGTAAARAAALGVRCTTTAPPLNGSSTDASGTGRTGGGGGSSSGSPSQNKK